MHELGIARDVHRLCRERLRGVAAARLVEVRLAVGELCAVEPELLRFAWQAVTAGGPDAGAELDVRWCPCRQVCEACGDQGERAPGTWARRCPRCARPLAIEGGRELDLLQLSYETPDDAEDAEDAEDAAGAREEAR
jgi:hydrogenase nickel incorporation protein HypA/HybF